MAKGSKTATNLTERFKAATSAPAEPAPRKKAAAPAAAPARRPARAPNRRPEAPGATAEDRFPVRVNLFISDAQRRELALAQLEDGIGISARIRGALEYWMEGRPQPDPETGEPTKPARQTAAIDLRAHRQGGR